MNQLHVLWADSSYSYQEPFKKYLNEQKDIACVKCVCNGNSAINEYREHVYDVVITDIVLPQIDGFGLIDYINNRDPRAFETPIIVFTGLKSTKLINTVCSQDIAWFITKPTTPKMLYNRITAVANKGSYNNYDTLDIDGMRPNIRTKNHNTTAMFSMYGIPLSKKKYYLLQSLMSETL